MKVLISGGGTGGHIYPAIAVADTLKEQLPDAEILFVGAQGKMEMQLVPAAGYHIMGLKVRGLQRRRVFANLSFPFRLAHSLWQANDILKTFCPAVVLGTGGYASGPVLYMAARRGIPTLVQEQNAVVGFTNRFLGRYVDKVCVAYPQLSRHFSLDKMVLTGNPVRREILAIKDKRAVAYEYFGLLPEKQCLLILGGSLGAQAINESILQALDQFAAAGVQILWPTGERYFERIQSRLTPTQRTWVKIFPLIGRIDLAYAAADVVISRAGALSIAELCVAQKPVIFVPSPNVTADHQTQNVLPLVRQNAALMVKDEDVPQELASKALSLLDQEAQQKLLVRNIEAWAKPQAAATIVEMMRQLAGQGKI